MLVYIHDFVKNENCWKQYHFKSQYYQRLSFFNLSHLVKFSAKKSPNPLFEII